MQSDPLRKLLGEVPAFLALLRSVECRLYEKAQPFEEPVLDLGCGDGCFAAAAFASPPCVGVDRNLCLTREARVRGACRTGIAASAIELPLPSESFRSVISNSVLEHIENVDAAIQEVARVLSLGGDFYFTVPSHRFGNLLLGSTLARTLGLKSLAQWYADGFNRRSVHYHVDRPEVWIQRLEAQGFRVVQWFSYFPPEAHRVFDFAHYLSLPSLLTRKTMGKWVLFPHSIFRRLFERWFRAYTADYLSDKGAYLFFHARKAGRE